MLQHPPSFGDLLRSLPGIYPSDVLRSLRRLGSPSPTTTNAGNKSPERAAALDSSHGVCGMLPHPLDYDWRYSLLGAHSLASFARCLAGPNGFVACIGAPSVAAVLAIDGGRTRVVSLDANHRSRSADGDAVALIFDAFRDDVPAVSADVVVLDPPWYPEYMRWFLWAATSMVRERGVVALSFPAAGTRPGIGAERADTVKRAEEFGLRLRGIRWGAAEYVSPPFERLSLRADGLEAVPADWRRGDVLVFDAYSKPHQAAKPELLDVEMWTDLTTASTRIKVRASHCVGSPVLRSIVPGDILPTVSRRDARRQQVTVWTATNRVYACDNAQLFGAIAEAESHGATDCVSAAEIALGRPLQLAEAHLVTAAADQARTVLEADAHDLASVGWQAS